MSVERHLLRSMSIFLSLVRLPDWGMRQLRRLPKPTVIGASDMSEQKFIVAGWILFDPKRRDEVAENFKDLVLPARSALGCLDLAITADPVDSNRINNLEFWQSDKGLTRGVLFLILQGDYSHAPNGGGETCHSTIAAAVLTWLPTDHSSRRQNSYAVSTRGAMADPHSSTTKRSRFRSQPRIRRKQRRAMQGSNPIPRPYASVAAAV
jgi:hypothetical protein